jgi:hypothetical protein
MKRLRFVLVLAMLLSGGVAFAGKSSTGSSGVRSSGGKSYSSGSSSSRPSSSSSRPSSSSSSSSRPSSSSSSPKPSSSSPKPSSSSSTPKPSGSGSSSTPKPSGGNSAPKPSSSSSKPTSSSYDSAAAGAAKKAESRSTYQRSNAPNLPPGGGNSSTPRNAPAGRSTTNESPAQRGRSYSSGSNRPVDSAPTYDVGAKPRSTYNDSKGQSRPLDPGDARVDNLRRTTTWDNWSTRSARSGNVFVNVGPPFGYSNVYYSDPYSNIFWWWLLSQSLDTRAYWAYNHYGMMDSLRYRDMLDRDKALEARIRQLEAEKVKRDPTYTPSGVDNDLMYNDGYVEAAVNPTVVVPEHAPGSPSHHSGISCLHFVLVAGIVVFLIWFIFFKRWTGA